MADASDPRPALSPSEYQPDKPLWRELSLYNGVSNRSRGWKTKKPEKFAEMQTPQKPGTVRWDGASMPSNDWDNLKRVCLQVIPCSAVIYIHKTDVGSRAVVS